MIFCVIFLVIFLFLVGAARDRAEIERKKLRQEMTRERERWTEELEEERAGVDRNMKEVAVCCNVL